jgi:hypothetical protein
MSMDGTTEETRRGEDAVALPVGLRTLACLCLLPLVFASCRTVIPVMEEDARQVALRFDASLPAQFTARQTLVFEFRPHWWWPPVRLAALGYATVDRTARDYAVVCLSPLGMKLFEVSCTGGQSRAVFSVPLPGNREAMGKALGDDIASLFFDLLPTPDAVLRRHGDTLVFRQERDGRRMEYAFSVSNGQLMRKTIRDGSGRTTLTFGAGGADRVGGYPAVVRLMNHRYGYTVTVRTRQLEDVPRERDGKE